MFARVARTSPGDITLRKRRLRQVDAQRLIQRAVQCRIPAAHQIRQHHFSRLAGIVVLPEVPSERTECTQRTEQCADDYPVNRRTQVVSNRTSSFQRPVLIQVKYTQRIRAVYCTSTLSTSITSQAPAPVSSRVSEVWK